MCLGIPVEIKKIKQNKATVSADGATYEADLSLVDDVHVGDYVILHAGYVLQKISKEEAAETMDMIRQVVESE